MARARSPRRARPVKSIRPSPVPPGYPTVVPYLAVEGGVAALEFYKKAFGAHEMARELAPDGRLISGRLRIGDSMIMLSDVFPGDDSAAPSSVGTTTVTLQLYTKDIDRLWDRAIAAGAKVVVPLEEQYWGERHGHLLDPFGHHWSLAMRVPMTRVEMAAKKAEAYASFARGAFRHTQPIYLDA
jgi:PhnB protein